MKNKITDLIANNVEGMSREDIFTLIEIPPKPELGDFAFPCFRLAKTMRKAPQMIAGDIKEKIGDVDFIDRIDVQGAYLNFFVNKTFYIKNMVHAALEENFGGSTVGNGKTICIDYSSPNVAKNFHVGHLRTTIIGNSLYKIYSKLGYEVVRINHLGDWGTQFGKLIVAYKAWGNEDAVKKDGVAELMKLYVKFHEEAEKNPELNDEARAWFSRMEHGDEDALAIWQWFKDISIVEYKRTYDLLGMDFDYYLGESFYRDKTDAVVDKLREAKLLTESDGAQIVNLDEYDMAPCLILKNDGSSIYATRDLAAIFYRKETYKFSKCLYVTGQEQKLHFAQVFKVVELLGNDWAKDELIHIPYGLVSLEGAKLSTRSGNIIYAEDILLEAVAKIKEIIEEKNPDIEDKEETAKKIGVGAVIFNDLYNQRIKDVSFKWEKLLNFDGETGPYVQYTYARCASILRKLEGFHADADADIDYSVLDDGDALALLKELSRFPKVVADAAEKYEPSVVARFAVDVAQAFNKFYNSNRINVDDEAVKKARATVVYITKRTIKDAMLLLGIECPERM
ncbi:MAG: arginine--tRNA ligase [Clostridium sp.]|nr:arginine--tRNA ligase [Clostridium sp.]MCM1460091.1 arginine--tRNA ligase [Bacteroides sp.]